nr:MAG TPA: tail protein [Caudoviricetes sp.]
MYKIYLDNKLLHHTNIDKLKIYEPHLKTEQNGCGSFEFNIENTNPLSNTIREMKSLVTVYNESDLIFRGRVLDKGEDTYKVKNIYCEGELAFLNDSIQDEYNFQGSIKEFLQLLLDSHNAQVEEYKRFYVGTVTVTDPNNYIVRSDTQYLNTWETIKKKLLELLGGYIVVRHVGDIAYIDYLADYTTLNNQKIKFGQNLLTVKRTESSQGIATVLIPLGAKNEETEKRLTIESVNNGKKYIEDSEGIELYGKIRQTVFFDDVTVAENLLSKGQKALKEMRLLTSTIEINAVDMASVHKDISNFRINAKIGVESKFHGINDFFVPMSIDNWLFKPQNNKITLNSKVKTLTGTSSNQNQDLNGILSSLENINNNLNANIPNSIKTLQEELYSALEQTAQEIKMQISERYYSKGEADELISNLETVLQQTSSYFEMQFNSFHRDLNDVIEGTNANFEESKTYIRFENGEIILGKKGNEYSFIIGREKTSFMQGEQEISYTSNSKVYNTMLEVTHSLQIGNFGFVPRKNGNLSFKLMKKVV